MFRRLRLSICAVLVCAVSSACAENSAASHLQPSVTPGFSTPTPVPVPSDPNPCAGVDGETATRELVAAGQSVALLSVTVRKGDGKVENNTTLVPVDASEVLAGILPDGGVKALEVATAEGAVEPLPPGNYLVLVGQTSTPSRYFLSDGLRGSFLVDGSNAYQRCPNSEDPGSPILIREGITDIDRLTALFRASLDVSGAEHR